MIEYNNLALCLIMLSSLLALEHYLVQSELYQPIKFLVLSDSSYCNFCSCGAPIGAYLLSAKVVGVLYDKEAAVYRSQAAINVAENTCLGTRCFGSSLLVLAFLCAVSAILNFWFMMRTRPPNPNTQQQPSSSSSPQKLRVLVD